MITPVILMDIETRSIEGILATFGKRKIPVIGLSSQSKPFAIYSKYIYKFIKSPALIDENKYLQFLLNLDWRGVIIYSTDLAAEFVSRYQEVLKKNSYLFNIPDLKSFKCAFNKDELYNTCQQFSVPTIRTEVVKNIDSIYNFFDIINSPLILKPTRLAGGKYLILSKKNEIDLAYKKMLSLIHSKENYHFKSKLIVQEFINYEYSDIFCCETVYNTQSKPINFQSVKKIRPNINNDGSSGSRLFAGMTISNELMEFYSRRLLDSLSWKGFAHLDWLYSRKYNDFLLCEVNPRLPGFSNFMTKIGFEMAWMYYCDLTNRKIPIYKAKKALYFEALRFPGDITNSVNAILKGHISLYSFIKSYFLPLSFRYKVHFDVFYPSDLKFTLVYWWHFIKAIIKRPFKNVR